MAVNPPAPPQLLKGVVERAFYYQGKVLQKGEAHELPRVFALEMQAAKKFTIEKAPEAPAVANPPSPSSPERRTEKKPAPADDKKGAKNAG